LDSNLSYVFHEPLNTYDPKALLMQSEELNPGHPERQWIAVVRTRTQHLRLANYRDLEATLPCQMWQKESVWMNVLSLWMQKCILVEDLDRNLFHQKLEDPHERFPLPRMVDL
jgi:hypothetical protein